MTEEEKLIKEQWDKLPRNLQQEINTAPWKAFVEEIGRANTLDSEQLVSLEREVMFVLYAFESPSDFVSNITREVGVSEERALAMAEDIAEKIFEPISQKVGEGKNASGLPMVEKGETAHNVPHVETTPTAPAQTAPTTPVASEPKPKVATPLPDYRYPDGADPYREPVK